MNSANDKTANSLKCSFSDGIFASAMIGFTQDYLTPFLLLLKATAMHVGLLSALPNLFASLIQLKSADVAEKLKSRKRVIIGFVLLQALMLIPMALMAFFKNAGPGLFILLVVLFTSFGAIANPAWASLMSDLVAKDKRGAYFGWRNRALGFIIVASTFAAGLILSIIKKINVYYAFAAIFGLAFVFRLISWIFLRKMYEPSLAYKKEHYFSLFDFIRNLRTSNYAKFVMFASAMSFSVNLASPFFAVLMLRDLHFSYLVYIVITIAATLTIYIMVERWGRHADEAGNLKIIKFTAPLLGFIPLLWIINRHPIFLVLAQIFSGFAWAGFNIAATNFIYDAVTPEKRTRCISYFNVFNGLGLCLGALLGGIFLQRLPSLFGYKILTLFLISAVLRMMVSFGMPRKLKEVRQVKKIRSAGLFLSMIGIRPILGSERKTLGY